MKLKKATRAKRQRKKRKDARKKFGTGNCKKKSTFWLKRVRQINHKIERASLLRNCGAGSVGVLQDNLVLTTELIM